MNKKIQILYVIFILVSLCESAFAKLPGLTFKIATNKEFEYQVNKGTQYYTQLLNRSSKSISERNGRAVLTCHPERSVAE